MRATASLLAAVLATVLSLGTPASLRADETRARLAALDPKYREWLEEVGLLIGKDERRQFLALSRDYQRDGFIHRFWEARNPVPGSARNAFKAQWEARLAAIRAEYGNITEDRARMRLLHGEPGGGPVATLAAKDFAVFDGGEPQTLLRCERVRDLPLHLLFAIDTSASMAASLPQMQQAALAFLQRTLTPKDRAALLSFSDSPVLRLPFTGDLRMLGGALAGLNAERGTALYDSLVYGLSYMRGVQHVQSALLLFTDGADHMSRLSFDETLEFARRAGIPIYAVGARVPRLDLADRGRLAKLAEETGGRSFFIDSAAELDGVYAQIEDELRSRYLIAYEPNAAPRAGEFRPVEVRVAGADLRVKTARGYYP